MLIEVLFILIAVSMACSLTGSLLFLRENLMIADAISHTVLLGIVIAFYFVEDLNSPWLIIGAALFGVFTVLAINGLTKTGQIEIDASTGLLFPFFFAIATIIISKYYANIHLDIDMVFFGQVELAPLKRIDIFGNSMPLALFQGILMLIINGIFILFHYAQLKLRLFDEVFARSIGIAVGYLDFVSILLVSLTAVSSFESVGTILVIVLMAAPPMTARCLSKSFSGLLIYTLLFAVFNAVAGYYIGVSLDSSLSGMVAVVSFFTFMVVFILTHVIRQPKTVQN